MRAFEALAEAAGAAADEFDFAASGGAFLDASDDASFDLFAPSVDFAIAAASFAGFGEEATEAAAALGAGDLDEDAEEAGLGGIREKIGNIRHEHFED
jgi:hypothetical protein